MRIFAALPKEDFPVIPLFSDDSYNSVPIYSQARKARGWPFVMSRDLCGFAVLAVFVFGTFEAFFAFFGSFLLEC